MGLGDGIPLRQATENSGYSKSLEIAPVRGDWLVERRGFELMAIAPWPPFETGPHIVDLSRDRAVSFSCPQGHTASANHKPPIAL
jgi:uncharacterized membrane protein